MGEFNKTEHLNGKVTLYGGDNRDVLKSLPDNSIDSIVTDPPYALVSIVKRFANSPRSENTENTENPYGRTGRGFMGKKWDNGEVAFATTFWAECLRVLKPGGHVVAFSGTRTYHRMAVAIEDAGFEIRDDILNMVATDSVAMRFVESLSHAQAEAFFKLMEESQFGGMAAWCYGSGFPKSHDVSKAIDKAAGAVREKVRVDASKLGNPPNLVGGAIKGDDRPWRQEALERGYHEKDGDEPATDAARQWQGWGTALKPAWEPICLARKPLCGTVAANVLEHGTGALNIDGCRVGDFVNDTPPGTDRYNAANHEHGYRPSAYGRQGEASADKRYTESGNTSFAPLPGTRGGSPSGRWPANIVHDGSDEVLAGFPDAPGQLRAVGPQHGAKDSVNVYGDYGPRQDFAPRTDTSTSAARFFYTAKADKLDRIGSKHPTVKPVDLMQWLCRLVTPPGGLVLDPFAGSGSTGEAAWREGMRCVLVEGEEEYQADIAERLALADKGPATRRARAIKQADNDNLPLFGGAEATGGVRGEGRQIYGHFADQDGRRNHGR